MKAVIVEIKGHNAAVLNDDGCIIKTKNKNYAVGQVIEMQAQAVKKPTRIVAWAVSAAAAIVLVSTAAWAYFTPYTYVSLDVNPSIEYSVNRFDRVLSATAVNGDGTEILKNLDLNNKNIDEAVKDTVEQIAKEGYFKGTDPGVIEISTFSENEQDAKKLAEELKTTAQQATEGNATPVEVEAVSVGRQRVLDAKALGTTPGKLNLVEKLKASAENPDSIDIKEWLNKPAKTIMKAIKENKKAASSAQKQSDNSSKADEGSSSAAQQKKKSSSSQNSESKKTEKSGAAGNKNEDSQITSGSDTSSSEKSKIASQSDASSSSVTSSSANGNSTSNKKEQGTIKNEDKGKGKNKNS